jgi:hypothetical protein
LISMDEGISTISGYASGFVTLVYIDSGASMGICRRGRSVSERDIAKRKFMLKGANSVAWTTRILGARLDTTPELVEDNKGTE